MLKLLYFLPCEKTVMSADGIATMVSVLDSINVEPSKEFSENTAIPFLWEIIATWFKENVDDSNKKFEQKVELYRPDKEISFETVTIFNSEPNHHTFRVINKFDVFPVGIAGTLWLKLSIRSFGEDNQWTQMAEFPIFLNHNSLGE